MERQTRHRISSMVAPRAVREELRQGLDLYRQGLGGDGLRGETVAWAQSLAYGDPVSAEKARKMVAWFARHGASVAESEARERQRRQLAQGELRGRAPALVAWLLWGGDSGRAWASKIAKPNSPDLAHVSPIGSDEAAYILGDLSRATKPNAGHGVPSALRGLLQLVREASSSCPLRGRYEPLAGGNSAMRGQCENASAIFHLLAGGTSHGWRMMRIGPESWSFGPHYFVRHVSGVVVDPTADQFPPGERIPYELARGQSAGGFRKVPDGAEVSGVSVAGQTTTPTALRAATSLHGRNVSAAILAARRWSLSV